MSELVEQESKKPITFQELQDNIKSSYEENPLKVLFPSNFDDEKIPMRDEMDLGTKLIEPRIEDLEIMVTAVIGCIPYVGAFCQSIFTCVLDIAFGREKPISEENLRKLIDEELEKLRKEMNEITDKKIAQSEIDMYKVNCNNKFKGFVSSSLDALTEDLAIFRSKYDRGLVPTQSFLNGLRAKQYEFRVHVKSLLSLFSDPRFIKYTYEKYYSLVFLHIMCLMNINAFWKQYDYDQIYVTGKLATPTVKRIRSFQEKMHVHIQRALNNLKELKETDKGLEGLYRLLTLDPIIYPVPVVLSNPSDIINSIVKVPLTTRTPFIYRFDAQYCKNQQSSSTVKSIIEPVSGCVGTLLTTSKPVEASIILSLPKAVRIRLFAAFDAATGITVDIKTTDKQENVTFNKFDQEDDQIPYLKTKDNQTYPIGISGLVKTTKFTNVQNLDLKVSGKGKLFFVEVVISDE
ncbi:hypothetical protein RB653_009840 [Dictyostelium firmibasis]|uniref:Pesticidal crystal protein N-terminal domain-containing protein n=1 Tax=Dictyostelium firmibasis TaxID=79012 RepID=A0AAN7TRY8_9MYCE